MKKFWLLENKIISIICISIYVVTTPALAVSNFSLIDSIPENSINASKELTWYPTSESSSLSRNEITFNLPFNSNRESRAKKSSFNKNLNDLIQEGSSKVEKRNRKVNRSSSQQKNRSNSKSSSSKNRKNSKLVRSGSESSKYNNRNNYNNLRFKVLPYSAYQQRLFYRAPARDYNRPVKIVNPKVFFYDFDDYYDYYDDRNRLRADYDSREDDESKESLEDLDEKASVEATTEDDETTTTESTTTEKNENNTTPSFHGYGYGPSHGHEHVSFTYGPNFNDNNYWHGQQQFPDTFNSNPYFTNFKK